MSKFHFRRISDAVHGTFGISELESDIISTRVFQRLHNVKQLGLANLVYPDLNYSRFAHSLGACHVAGRMVQAINVNCPGRTISEDDRQFYRLAALLHDLGHYPFSHAMEHAVENHYKELLLKKEDGADAEHPAEAGQQEEAGKNIPVVFRHESLGRRIIDEDPEIGEVLKKHGIAREELKTAFPPQQPGKLVSIVSSDLDCDRIDYLMRTARHSGLPYGAVDAEYLIGQTCTDADGHLCLANKALRAADHLLVSRYFDYTQVVYHKTVVALEQVLQDVIREMLKRGILDCSGKSISQQIKEGNFSTFDDFYVTERMRTALGECNAGEDYSFAIKLRSILDRRAPKLVAASERIWSRGKNERRVHKNLVQQIRDKVPQWAGQSGVAEDLWHVWDISLQMTKIGSLVSVGAIAGGADIEEEAAAQGVRILTTRPDHRQSKSQLLVEHEYALAHSLSNSNLYAIRLYVHLTGPEDQIRQKREQITSRIKSDLPDFPFTV